MITLILIYQGHLLMDQKALSDGARLLDLGLDFSMPQILVNPLEALTKNLSQKHIWDWSLII